MIRPYYQDSAVQIFCGDALAVLRSMPDESIHCCVTSPPYWGLRDYKVAGQLGLEKSPEEYVSRMAGVFGEVRRVLRGDGTLWMNIGDSYAAQEGQRKSTDKAGPKQLTNGGSHGTPSRSAIGLKPKDLVGIPWLLAKALRDPYYTGRIKNVEDRIWLAAMIDGEGCMFIHKRKAGQNNGQGYERKTDSFGAGLEVANTHRAIVDRCLEITGIGSVCTVERETVLKKRNIPLHRWNVRSNQCREIIREVYPYLVGKQHEARLLLGCPSSGKDAELAHAGLMALHNGGHSPIDFSAPASMFEQGFYLRSDIIWSKANPMPESVTDRPTKAHEYLFLLSKSQSYFYDQEAIKEPITYLGSGRQSFGGPKLSDGIMAHTNEHGKSYRDDRKARARENHKCHPNTERNGIRPYKTPDGWDTSRGDGGHGSIHRSGREKGQKNHGANSRMHFDRDPAHPTDKKEREGIPGSGLMRNKRSVWTIATESFPDAHFATFPRKLVEPCILAGSPAGGIVLDPFAGSGTTGLVAKNLGRSAVLIELNEEYAEMAKNRMPQEVLALEF